MFVHIILVNGSVNSVWYNYVEAVNAYNDLIKYYVDNNNFKIVRERSFEGYVMHETIFSTSLRVSLERHELCGNRPT